MPKSAQRKAVVTTAIEPGEDPALPQFRRDLEAGEPWLDSLFLAIGAWTTSEENVHGRRYRYLVGGEAFDWLLLAERLLLAVDGLVPPAEAAQLLFHGKTYRSVSDAEFRALIGETKHRAAMNYWYGVRVEEALIMAVQHETRKARRGSVRHEENTLDESVYQNIYGASLSDLLKLYRTERRLRAEDGMNLDELREFTYWLFKRRRSSTDKERLASDTKKGLLFLNRIDRASTVSS